MTIQYNETNGYKWYAYVLGAKVWELRANASDVLTAMDDHVGNLDSIINLPAMKGAVQTTLAQMFDSTKQLAGAAQATCSNMAPTNDIVKNCTNGTMSLTDPNLKICTLAKVAGFNNTALTNIVVAEIMNRTTTMHNQVFGSIFQGVSSDTFSKLINHCSKETASPFLAVEAIPGIGLIVELLGERIMLKYIDSCTASCLDDGKDYYTYDSWISAPNSGGASSRHCRAVVRFNLGDALGTGLARDATPFNAGINFSLESIGYDVSEVIKAVTQLVHHTQNPKDIGSTLERTNSTYASGFGGMIEAMIRLQVCKQKHATDANKCDAIGIADKPAGK